MENNDYANSTLRTPAGNDKAKIDSLANELMKYGIMATAFASAWPVAFLGIAFGKKAQKLEKEFISLEGRTYNCAKVGAICGKVGRILGLVMTIFLAVYITYFLVVVGILGMSAFYR